MDDESTAKLRGLLENASRPATLPAPMIESGRLRNALKSTRNWLLIFLLVCLCGSGQVIFVTLIDLFRMNQDNPFPLWIGFLILTVPLLLPLIFMSIYAFRLHEFLKFGQPESLVRLLVAQRWMWTVLGIYAVLFIVLTGLLLILLLGTLVPAGF